MGGILAKSRRAMVSDRLPEGMSLRESGVKATEAPRGPDRQGVATRVSDLWTVKRREYTMFAGIVIVMTAAVIVSSTVLLRVAFGPASHGALAVLLTLTAIAFGISSLR